MDVFNLIRNPIGSLLSPSDSTGGGAGAGAFYKCASVDTANKKWSGNKAIQAEDGTWNFDTALTSSLSYGKRLIPVIGEVYSSDATLKVAKYCISSPLSKACFYASLTEDKSNTETGQILNAYNSPQFSEYETLKCCNFYESQYFRANTDGILTNQSPRTYSVEIRRGNNVHMKYLMSHGSNDGYCFRCYSTNNGVSIFGGGLDNNVGKQLPESWTRLTIVYTGTQWKVYFGTTLEMTVNLTVTEEPPETELLSIGAHLDGSCAYDGHMRNFTIFPYALSENEITALQSAFE